MGVATERQADVAVPGQRLCHLGSDAGTLEAGFKRPLTVEIGVSGRRHVDGNGKQSLFRGGALISTESFVSRENG